MPIRPPALDDRRYDDLVAELVSRIPAHTPEWTHPRAGDPGRTLIELFAWLGDALLYRANLIPERQRLAFLRLLGEPLRAARPARGLVTIGDTQRDGPCSHEPWRGASSSV
jgi:predicted phage baseplate assembly protein